MNSDFFQDPLEGQTGIFENPLLQPPGEGLEIHQNDTTPQQLGLTLLCETLIEKTNSLFIWLSLLLPYFSLENPFFYLIFLDIWEMRRKGCGCNYARRERKLRAELREKFVPPLDVVEEAMEILQYICEEKKIMKDDCNFHELQKKLLNKKIMISHGFETRRKWGMQGNLRQDFLKTEK